MPGTAAYVRRQAIGAAVVNAVVNPALEWVLNRTRGFQPFLGANGVAANLVVTSVILSVLVALFAARGARRKLAISPRRPGWLGACSGVGAAVAVVAALWLLDRSGVAGLSFPAFVMVKAGYCGFLGFVVVRLTLWRVPVSGQHTP